MPEEPNLNLKEEKKMVRRFWGWQINRAPLHIRYSASCDELRRVLRLELQAAQTMEEVETANDRMYEEFWNLFKEE